MSLLGTVRFDERWLRLALLIHETSANAMKPVLDDVISTKHADLKGKAFEEKLATALVRDEALLKSCLLVYERPTVFPTAGCSGSYQDFDIGIVGKLIKYYVGKSVWANDTTGFPDVASLQNVDLIRASRFALVHLLREYRNWVFHHTGSPPFSEQDFCRHWDNAILILQGLGYDVNTLSRFKTATLDYGDKAVVDTIKKLLSKAIARLQGQLVARSEFSDFREHVSHRLEGIEFLISKLQLDMLTKDYLDHLSAKIEKLLVKAATKEDFQDLQERFKALQADARSMKDTIFNLDRRLQSNEEAVQLIKVNMATRNELNVACEGLEKKLQDVQDEASATEEAVQKMQADMITRDEFKAACENLEKSQADCQVLEVATDDQVRQAKEACWLAHDSLLRSREVDLYGDPIESKHKSDLMVSLVTVKCADADAARLSRADEVDYHVRRDFTHLITLTPDDMFKGDRLVLVRGLPGSGKTTFCHFLLREWRAMRLWHGRYDFVFYVNAPFLVTFLRSEPFSVDRVLKVLYPHVFRKISYEQLSEFKYLLIVDSIDECDIEKICAFGNSQSAEDAIKQLIVSPENYDRIIVGRPHACDQVREKLLKSTAFQFVEVVGFSTEQLKLYVKKFCEPDVLKAEDVWRKIQENDSLLGMAHLPVFANIACTILCDYDSVVVKTQTELYVWAYSVFLTRHLKGNHPYVDSCTFENLFRSEQLIHALVRVSEMAFENLSTGKIFFKSSDYRFTEIEPTLLSPFLVRRQQFLCFAHLTFMEFLAAVHLFVSGVEFDETILGQVHLRGALPMLFGLLGAAVENSDSALIVRDFVQPLVQRFVIRPREVHPLCGRVSESLFHADKHRKLYLNLFYEFRNSHLLESGNMYWDDDADLAMFHHHELDRLLFFTKHFMGFEKRTVGLVINPVDHQLSISECAKIHDGFVAGGCKLDRLGLFYVALSEEKMQLLAPVFCLMSRLDLLAIQPSSEECWEIFLRCVENGYRNKTLRLAWLEMFFCEVGQDVKLALEKLVSVVMVSS